LRPARLEDASLIARWLGEPDNRRFLTSNLRENGLSAALIQVGLRRKDQAWYLFGADASDAAPVGLIAVDSIDRIDGIGNLWFVLGEAAYRRRGLTARAIEAFCRANPLDLNVLTAWAGEPNEGSLACLRCAGFREVGRIPNAFAVDGGRFARILFERQLQRAAGEH
jgi:RimJ/RimL family protein N-acetyltransferase